MESKREGSKLLKILANVNAGGSGKWKNRKVIRDLRFIQGVDVEETASLPDARRAVRSAIQEGYPAIGWLGGDGTATVVQSMIVEECDAIAEDKGIEARLPVSVPLNTLGTVADLARSLEVPKTPVKHVEKVVGKLRGRYHLHTVEMSVMNMNGKHGWLCAAGTMPMEIMGTYYGKDAEEGKKPPKWKGLVMVPIMVYRAFRDPSLFAPSGYRLFVDGKEIKGDNNVILAGTHSCAGPFFENVLGDITEHPGYMRLVIANPQSTKETIGIAVRAQRGLRQTSKNIVYFDLAQELVIVSDGKIKYTRDGEMLEADKELSVKVDRTVRVVPGYNKRKTGR